MNSFTFDGINSLTDLGVYVQKKDVFSSASPDVTAQTVPGRSGDLLIDNGRWKNGKVSYTCAILSKDFEAAARKIRAALASRGKTYRKLADTYDTGYFRLAAILSEIKITQNKFHDGIFTVEFNSKPFRYSEAGQTERALTNGGTVTNAEAFSSEPYFRIVGNGSIVLTVNGVQYPLSSVSGYIELDSEIQDVHKGTSNENAKANFLSFPTLSPGSNVISWTGSASVYMIPRWRTL